MRRTWEGLCDFAIDALTIAKEHPVATIVSVAVVLILAKYGGAFDTWTRD